MESYEIIEKLNTFQYPQAFLSYLDTFQLHMLVFLHNIYYLFYLKT